MTKKHFIALAAEIKRIFNLDKGWETRREETQAAALYAVEIVCNVARQDNPRFDENRFRAACGVPLR